MCALHCSVFPAFSVASWRTVNQHHLSQVLTQGSFLISVFSFSRLSRLSAGVLLFAAALVFSAESALAQTAPQLLPYTVSVVAGGGPATTFTAGGACPTTGYTSTDTIGDGCPATDITLTTGTSTSSSPNGPRYAIADSSGAIFFSDANNSVIRRIDPATGVVNIIAGGVSASPSAGKACGANLSLDSRGDGCLSTAVHLSRPMGLAFASNGDLIFADAGQYDVRRIAATSGFIPSTGGVISNIAGYAAGAASYGYTVSNGTTTINAATQSYLDEPTDVAVDAQGDILISEEYKNAILVVNPNATATTVTGVTVAPGAIIKVTGASTGAAYVGTPYCPNGTSGTYGCNYNPYTEGANANMTYLDSPWAVAADPTGNLYIANEYNNVVPKVSSTGVLSTYAGNQTAYGKTLMRATAGSFGIGSPFGVAADSSSNIYITDALNGVIWRVDAGTKSMYVVAGGGTACSTSTDGAYGDGCPATQATFGKSGTTYATATNPGIFGITVDTYSDLYVGDTITDLIREVSSGTQFGRIGLNGATQTVDVHFAAGDMEASAGPFTITSGSAIFTVGTYSCTTNTDSTRDCLVPLTAVPTVLGKFTGTLQVAATKGGTVSFPLNGIYVNTPATRTTVTATPVGAASCSSTTYSTATQFTLTAKVASSGTPGGTVTFYDNGTAIGTPQSLSSGTATLPYMFSTPGVHTVTAKYSGDGYYVASTGTAAAFTTANPGFTLATDPATTGPASTVSQGGTALYGFVLAQSVYSGTISFACSGLPANATCVFSPNTITATGCSTTSTVAVSIYTKQGTPVGQSSFAAVPSGRWPLFFSLMGVLGLAGFGVRRRGAASRLGQLGIVFAALLAASALVACGNGTKTVAGTPLGTSTVTVTATGSAGSVVASMPVTLTVQ